MQEQPVTHEDIHARLASGQQRFTHVEGALEELKQKIAHVEGTMWDVKQALQEVIRGQEEFRETIKPISEDIADIKNVVGLYQAAGVLGKAIKWLSGILGGIVVVWVFAKAGAKALVGGL